MRINIDEHQFIVCFQKKVFFKEMFCEEREKKKEEFKEILESMHYLTLFYFIFSPTFFAEIPTKNNSNES